MSKRQTIMWTAGVSLLASAVMPWQVQAFTAQLPIDGFDFLTNIGHVSVVEEGQTTVYEVPETAIAVVTDVHFTSVGATDTQLVGLKRDFANELDSVAAGPFLVTPEEGFTKSYTSGLIWIEGQNIIVQNSGPEPVTVNLVGYLVCRGSCD